MASFFEQPSSKQLNFGSVALIAFSSILNSKYFDLFLQMKTILHEGHSL